MECMVDARIERALALHRRDAWLVARNRADASNDGLASTILPSLTRLAALLESLFKVLRSVFPIYDKTNPI